MNKGRLHYLLKLVNLYFTSYRSKAILSITMSIVSGFFSGINLVLLIPLINLLNNSGEVSSTDKFTVFAENIFSFFNLEMNLFSILIFFLIIITFTIFLNKSAMMINISLQQKFVTKLRCDFFSLLAGASWDFVRRKHSSVYIKLVTTDINQSSAAINQIMKLYSSVLTALISLIVAMFLSTTLTLFGIITVGFLFLILRKNNTLIFGTSINIQTGMKEIFGKLIELINGVKTAKILGIEDYHVSRFSNTNLEIQKNSIIVQEKQQKTKAFYSLLAAIFMTVFIYISVEYFQTGSASLLLLILIFSRLTNSFSQIQQVYQRILSFLPAFIDYDKYLRQLEKVQENKSEDIEIKNIDNGIEFHSVNFSYGEKSVLININLFIQAGQIIVMTGESGIGKTTIADLISGLLKPDSGRITINKKELNDNIVYSWRKKIAYVSQETFLYDLSIKENLLLSNPIANENDINEALTKASIHTFVNDLPKGINTTIGEKGSRLSVGEKQRLAIAMAIIRKPLLLILDEATSALDSENEKSILETIKTLTPELTTFIISHKPMALEYADLIYKLSHGKIERINK